MVDTMGISYKSGCLKVLGWDEGIGIWHQQSTWIAYASFVYCGAY
jgi:hypothetical protein